MPIICVVQAIMILSLQRNPASLATYKQEAAVNVSNGGNTMAWSTPVIVEVCVGMEVTSYASAEI
jgi:coenzyme PQQ precursor peptide PqqA